MKQSVGCRHLPSGLKPAGMMIDCDIVVLLRGRLIVRLRDYTIRYEKVSTLGEFGSEMLRFYETFLFF